MFKFFKKPVAEVGEKKPCADKKTHERPEASTPYAKPAPSPDLIQPPSRQDLHEKNIRTIIHHS